MLGTGRRDVVHRGKRFLWARLTACATLLVGMVVVVGLGASAATAANVTPTPTWAQLAPPNSPAARFGASMAYDSGTGQLVLFGGYELGLLGNDTWTWDGSTWAEQSPAQSPPARLDASMAYDTGTGQLVLFGGSPASAPGALGDTWTWDGSNWTEQSPAQSPPARLDASMAYDPGTGQLVLFGGEGYQGDRDSGLFLGDTWTWDGSNWTEQSPAQSPPARYGSPMAYDPSTGQLVLFGGQGYVSYLGDTWTWDGSNWTEQSPAQSPPARWDTSMAYDPSTGQLVLFGGWDGSNSLGDTWTWDGSTWAEQSPSESPSPRLDASMAYDPSTGQLVLFGGSPGTGVLGDTWVYGSAGQALAITSAAGGDIYYQPSGKLHRYHERLPGPLVS